MAIKAMEVKMAPHRATKLAVICDQNNMLDSYNPEIISMLILVHSKGFH